MRDAASVRLLPPDEARRCGCGKPNTTGLCAYPAGECPREQSAARVRGYEGNAVPCSGHCGRTHDDPACPSYIGSAALMCRLSTESEPIICDGGCGLKACPKASAAGSRYREALELILALYHSRLPEDLPTLPFQMKEVALAALAAEADCHPACVEAWPECDDGAYHPSCCRFPKSCSCTIRRDAPPSDAARVRGGAA